MSTGSPLLLNNHTITTDDDEYSASFSPSPSASSSFTSSFEDSNNTNGTTDTDFWLHALDQQASDASTSFATNGFDGPKAAADLVVALMGADRPTHAAMPTFESLQQTPSTSDLDAALNVSEPVDGQTLEQQLMGLFNDMVDGMLTNEAPVLKAREDDGQTESAIDVDTDMTSTLAWPWTSTLEAPSTLAAGIF